MTTISWSSRGTTHTAATGSVQASNYVTAARTPDGRLVMAYVPEGQTIGVDMSKLAARVRARWYDPTTGTYRRVPGSPFDNAGTREVLASREQRRGGPGLGSGSDGFLSRLSKPVIDLTAHEQWGRNLRISRGFAVRLRGVEPPRPVRATRPSTLRVYQFRHSRLRAVDDSRRAGSSAGRGWRSFGPERCLKPSVGGGTLRTCVRPSHRPPPIECG